jgi:hypothetical protein
MSIVLTPYRLGAHKYSMNYPSLVKMLPGFGGKNQPLLLTSEEGTGTLRIGLPRWRNSKGSDSFHPYKPICLRHVQGSVLILTQGRKKLKKETNVLE